MPRPNIVQRMITGQANLGRLLEIQVSVRLYSDDRDLPHTSFIECNWQGLYSGEKNESISDEGLKKRHVGQQKKIKRNSSSR
jgi:hypothetical protein